MTAWNLIPEYGRWGGAARRGPVASVAAVAVLVVTGEVPRLQSDLARLAARVETSHRRKARGDDR